MATGRSRSGSRPDDEPSGSWMEGSRSGHYELAPDSAPAGGGRGVGRDGENREAGRERATSGQGQQDLTGARACQCADDPKGRGGRTRWRCEGESGRGCEVAGVHDELESAGREVLGERHQPERRTDRLVVCGSLELTGRALGQPPESRDGFAAELGASGLPPSGDRGRIRSASEAEVLLCTTYLEVPITASGKIMRRLLKDYDDGSR